MGMGWDLAQRAITIDTRWGVPRYSTTLETETYMLDGEQLTPVAHRGAPQPRTTGDKVFHTRVEGQFRRIVRHGTGPSDYWWEVTDKNGMRYFYGGTTQNNGPLADGLLAKVTQYAQDGVTEFNQHRFEYFDEVSTPTANLLNAFGPPQSFTGASTVQGDGLLSGFSSTAFGGSATTNQQVHFYGGIGEAVKEISAGFKVGADSGRTTTKLSLLDIDGDGLLDQVYQSGGQFAYRSNTGGPRSSGINFAPQVAFALPDLGRENSNTTTFGVQGFAIGINGLADFSLTRTRGEAYISDVNGDGLPDVVTGGTVFFNRLVGGKPAFDTTSPTPLGSSAASNTSGLVTDPNEARADIEAANSLADPLRRWVAPYTGTVSIVGDVRLVTTPAAGYATADGVRVAVQQNASEIFNLVLDNPADTTPKPILGLTVVPVTAGDRIYFRVNSRNDGSFDQVEFNPTITYTAFDANARDENALPVYVYNAAADFAYCGSTLTITTPVNGLATLAGSFVKSGVTSDDVSVRISQNGVV